MYKMQELQFQVLILKLIMLTNGIMADVIRGPFLIVACSIQKRIIIKNDKLEIAPMLRLGISADHRFVDLKRANDFVQYVKKIELKLI